MVRVPVIPVSGIVSEFGGLEIIADQTLLAVFRTGEQSLTQPRTAKSLEDLGKMASSCGNPETETDALMARRPKFDKSKTCIRCKQNTGNVVIRHAVYCKTCFEPLIANRFRRFLEPAINQLPDGPRRKAIKASGNICIGFSGGLGSTVLLELVNRTYFSHREGAIDPETGKPRGGKDHPRNDVVWSKATVCYVEVCNAIPGMKDRTEEVRKAVEKYSKMEFFPVRIEDAFDHEWWRKIGASPTKGDLAVDLTNEDLYVSSMSSSAETPLERLRHYISSLPTQTAIPSAIQVLTRMLLLNVTMSTGSSHLALGTCLTSLSISLISSISQGGGFTVREESQEEWTPERSSMSNGHKNGMIRIVRPLRDIGMKECAVWAWWQGLNVVGKEKIPGSVKQSIGPLTKDFIVGLERDYPSTVSAIARTCAKLTPKQEPSGNCILCQRPVQPGIPEWKSQISIRSFKEALSHPPAHYMPSNSSPASNDVEEARSSLTPLLCYSCHTTFTSKSSRGTVAHPQVQQSVPLPVWVSSSAHLGRSDSVAEQGQGEDEVWAKKKLSEDQMKAAVADFLLDE